MLEIQALEELSRRLADCETRLGIEPNPQFGSEIRRTYANVDSGPSIRVLAGVAELDVK